MPASTRWRESCSRLTFGRRAPGRRPDIRRQRLSLLESSPGRWCAGAGRSVVWAIIGAVAAVQAPPHRACSTSGAAAPGSPRRPARITCSTGVSRAPSASSSPSRWRARRRRQPPVARLVLDSLLAALTAQPYVRGRDHLPRTGDTTFLSRDRRTTFFVVALRADQSGDSARAGASRPGRRCGACLPRCRTVRDTARRSPAGPRSISTCARSPPRTASEGEQPLLPLTLVILVLAFGALVAAVLPLVIGFLAIAVSLAIIGLLTADHADVGLRAEHDHDDRSGRGHRLLAAGGHPVPGGAEPRAPRPRGGGAARC